MVPCFPLLELTPSGLFMGSISTLIYTSELILCFTICVSKTLFKVAQNSFQHFPRRRFWWVIIATLNQLMLQSWYQKNCPITGEHVGIIFVTLYVTIGTL